MLTVLYLMILLKPVFFFGYKLMHQKAQKYGISLLIFLFANISTSVFQLPDIYYREFPISDWPGRFCPELGLSTFKVLEYEY